MSNVDINQMKKIFIVIAIVSVFAFFSCAKDGSSSSESASVGTGGSLARFTIYGDYLYTVDHAILKTFSLEDPQNPKLLSAQNVGWDIETIYPYDGKLFIGSMEAMFIYSLDTPDKPSRAGSATHVRACDPVVALDDHAYVTVRAGTSCGGTVNALLVYDVATGTYPYQIAQVDLQSPYGLGIKENTLFVCDGKSGLKVFDVSDPASPALLTSRGDYFFKDCIVYGEVLICMVQGGMLLYDITELNNPKLIDKVI